MMQNTAQRGATGVALRLVCDEVSAVEGFSDHDNWDTLKQKTEEIIRNLAAGLLAERSSSQKTNEAERREKSQ
eukprot:scaffold2737_cov229-Pinguiococcus_pyrenoidosus.AAC.2